MGTIKFILCLGVLFGLSALAYVKVDKSETYRLEKAVKTLTQERDSALKEVAALKTATTKPEATTRPN